MFQEESATAEKDVKESSTAVGDVKESGTAVGDVEESSTAIGDVEESSTTVDVKDSSTGVGEVEESSRDVDKESRVEVGVEDGSSRSTTTKLKSRKRKLAQKLALRKRRKIASEEGLVS